MKILEEKARLYSIEQCPFCFTVRCKEGCSIWISGGGGCQWFEPTTEKRDRSKKGYIDGYNAALSELVWKKYEEEKPPEGEEVLAFHSQWIDEDHNPNGTRVGFETDAGFISAHWWSYHDCYMTISHDECDDNQEYGDNIKNSIDPELWISLNLLVNLSPK